MHVLQIKIIYRMCDNVSFMNACEEKPTHITANYIAQFFYKNILQTPIMHESDTMDGMDGMDNSTLSKLPSEYDSSTRDAPEIWYNAVFLYCIERNYDQRILNMIPLEIRLQLKKKN